MHFGNILSYFVHASGQCFTEQCLHGGLVSNQIKSNIFMINLGKITSNHMVYSSLGVETIESNTCITSKRYNNNDNIYGHY